MQTSVNSSGGDSSDGEVLSVSIRHERDSWILDSGATFHMCPHRHWFVDYKPMKGTVYLGDDKPLSEDGSERVKLRMFDGVIRSIECWHVPRMKRNLIYLLLWILRVTNTTQKVVLSRCA